ncbi:MAG TPA: type VI secretion system protein TssA, partial [Burkholderiaceae bacterium]|nr:type VI secretion system protein TssA [Burkholderiaceae bacterium]
DLQYLLAEATEAPPAGPDLEYDPAFLALESAAQGKPEQDVAGTIVPAIEPDWPEVLAQARVLLARSKDLRAAMQLVRGATRVEHLGGFVDAITFVNDLITRYWSDLHPRLDADDNNDPTLRLSALAALEASRGASATETLLRDLRDAAVVPPTPQARVTVRDLLILDGKLPGAVGTLSSSAVDGILREAIAKDPGVVDVAGRAVAAVQRLRSTVADHVGGEAAPDVGAVVDMLKPVAARMMRLAGRGADEALGVEPGVMPTQRSGGAIQSREDVVRVLETVCDYLERTEPANPAPLLLRRAQRLLNKNFVELIADLVPDGVGQVRLIAGLKDE